MPAVPAAAEGAGQLEDLDEPPEPRVRGASGRATLMKPLVVLALPGMYLFYKYSQYRREQRELSRRRVTERELQHLHHKIDKLLTKLEKNEPELASSQEDETEVFGAAMKSTSSDGSVRAKRSPQDPMCGPPNRPPCGPPMGPPPDMSDFTTPMSTSTAALAKRSADDPQSGGEQGQPSLSGLAGTMGNMAGTAAGMMPEMAGAVANEMGNMAHRAGEMMG